MTAQFYRAGFFDGPVGDVDIRYMIPSYECSACHVKAYTHTYSYPHLDPSDTLTKEQLKLLNPKRRTKYSDEEMIGIVKTLRDKWNIPVAVGTLFGSCRLKVTQKPKYDFYVLLQHAGLFCRRSVVSKLLEEGFIFEHLLADTYGKHGEIAGFRELVVPVIGHVAMPVDKTFCSYCNRYSPGGSFKTVLDASRIPKNQPFFKTIETGVMIFSGDFIAAVQRLGLTGFVEGKTIHPVLTMHDGGLIESKD